MEVGNIWKYHIRSYQKSSADFWEIELDWKSNLRSSTRWLCNSTCSPCESTELPARTVPSLLPVTSSGAPLPTPRAWRVLRKKLRQLQTFHDCDCIVGLLGCVGICWEMLGDVHVSLMIFLWSFPYLMDISSYLTINWLYSSTSHVGM